MTSNATRSSKSKARRGWILGVYLLAVLLSNIVRWSAPTPPAPADSWSIELPSFTNDGVKPEKLQRVNWLTWQNGAVLAPSNSASDTPTVAVASPASAPLVMLHGSPGSASNFKAIAPQLAHSRKVLALDLPGFGFSSSRVPSYSIKAHARSVIAWMDSQQIDKANLLGFSMGGGVALELWEMAPERVASITMLAAIGVQELELLGDYHLNHLLHGLQLVGLEGLRLLTPNFGLLDGMLDYSYERNFYDTDQRPLRAILERYDLPMLILHGEQDPLVPKEAAVEHSRIVPQSQLEMRPDSHFFVFRPDSGAAATINDFLDAVDRGTALERATADPERVIQAAVPFDANGLPRWSGPALLIVLLLIAGATLISEDLTLIGTGLLVAQGRIAYLPASLAAFVGIVAGDMLLFWAGRALGRRIVRRRPFSWWLSPQAIRESSKWLRKRGAIVVLITRVLPGARLPTNIAAGLLRTSALRFLLYFLLAGAFWTFPVVWLTTRLGERLLPQLGEWRWRLLAGLLLLGGMMWLVRKLVVPLATWRGRRQLLGAWKHRTRWEFWPSLFIYLPLVPYFLFLALRHRSLTIFTATNPGIPAGGFVGESKSQILRALPQDVVPAWVSLPAGQPATQRLDTLKEFFAEQGLAWPLVVKPDVGERGEGVLIARSWDEVDQLLHLQSKALIGQAFAAGNEYSVFWIKRPSAAEGRIYSVTIKRKPTVTGDGKRTLYDLILADQRAVALAATYLEERPDAKERIPEAGEVVELSEVGAHSRGTIFEEGSHLITEELHGAIASIAARFENPQAQSTGATIEAEAATGFDFGRFDIITDDDESLKNGRNLHVLELNGITSESTNIYDQQYSIFDGLKVLANQWRHCFAIGAERRKMGYKPTGVLQLLRDWRQARS